MADHSSSCDIGSGVEVIAVGEKKLDYVVPSPQSCDVHCGGQRQR